MQKFISNLMRDKIDIPALDGGLPDDDSLSSVIKAPADFDAAAENIMPTDAEKRNAEIFSNLTFDSEGNPLQ